MIDNVSTANALLILTALGGLIVIIGGQIVQIVLAIQNKSKAAELITKVDEVHTTTNSGLSNVKSELTTSNALNAELHTTIRDLKAEREKVALRVALETPVPVIPVTVGIPVLSTADTSSVEKSLESIDKSAKAIDRNTK